MLLKVVCCNTGGCKCPRKILPIAGSDQQSGMEFGIKLHDPMPIMFKLSLCLSNKHYIFKISHFKIF